MRFILLTILLCFRYGNAELWPKGVVHYAINSKDYDMHSQDEIMATLSQIQNEICVKFFNSPFNNSTQGNGRILYISNPGKMKTCPPMMYDYSRSVVDMPIGYKCLNRPDIARIVVDMLRSSVNPSRASAINSYDLIAQFDNQKRNSNTTSLLNPADRNYINAHYHKECVQLETSPGVASGRRQVDPDISGDVEFFESFQPEFRTKTLEWYKDKIWPLGVVMFGFKRTNRSSIEPTRHEKQLTTMMGMIQKYTCVVFQDINRLLDDDILDPRNYLYFGDDGDDDPALGFKPGKQTIKLESMVVGASGHISHITNNLMRILGIPMMSNRYDRNNYVIIEWKYVKPGKEHLLEKLPEEAWFKHQPYDFASVTHAPVNYACGEMCNIGIQTVHPIQDHLWQRARIMGHVRPLSIVDTETINLLYSKECERRSPGASRHHSKRK